MKKVIWLLIFLMLCVTGASALCDEETQIISSNSKTTASVLKVGVRYRGKAAEKEGTRWFKFHTEQAGEYNLTIKAINLRTLGTFTNYTSTIKVVNEWDEVKGTVSIPTPHGYTTKSEASDGKTYHLSMNLDENEDYYILQTNYYDSKVYGNYLISICGEESHLVSNNSKTTKRATCIDSGISATYCDLCGVKAKMESIPATGHTPAEWKNEQNPTCAKPGLSVQRCATCKEIIASEEIPALGHDQGETVVAIAPTCIQMGKRVLQCTRCHEVLSSEEMPMVGHEIGMMQTVKPATCLNDGRGEQRCKVCNVLMAEEMIPAKGHTADVWKNEAEATCETDGRNVQRCVDCMEKLNEEILPAYGHMAGEWKEIRRAACQQTGIREKKCTRCDLVYETETTDALGHGYTAWKVMIEATKEHEGEQIRHCVRCGKTETEKIPKIPKFLGIF